MTKTEENKIINQALKILKSRLSNANDFITSPQHAQDYLTLKIANLDYEVFYVMFLNTRHGVVKFKELFRGTLDGANVYPREVVKEALKVNAKAIIIAHNHPSGIAIPSNADKAITIRLQKALELVDVQMLDHIIVGHTAYSFSENGLL